jgi:hypothetical protein
MLGRGLNQDTLLKDSPDAPYKVYVYSTFPMIYANPNPLSFVYTTSKQTGDIVCLTSYRSPREDKILMAGHDDSWILGPKDYGEGILGAAMATSCSCREMLLVDE